MTGGEIVPTVASVAGKAAEAVLGEDETVQQHLARMAEDTPPMRQAAQKYAERVAIKQAILTKMYWPIAKLFRLRDDYFRDDFVTDMGERLASVPEENLAEPKASIAVPAMEALGYSLDEPTLKNMYLNLLATATDTRTASTAHPSFVEVIRQLSAEEATLLNDILSRHPSLPIARIKIYLPSGDYQVRAKHVINLRHSASDSPVTDSSCPVWVDNWVRLGLVSVDYLQHLTAPGRYDWVEQRPEYESAKALAEQLNQSHVEDPPQGQHTAGFDKGLLSVTDFGLRFAEVVGASHTAGSSGGTEQRI